MDIPEVYQFNSVKKAYTLDQDKAIHPQISYNKAYRKLRSAFPKIPFQLKEIHAKDGIFVYDFCDDLINQHGKGATKAQAKASAIMEFSERFSWLNFEFKQAPQYQQESFLNLVKTNPEITNIEKSFIIPYSEQKKEICAEIKKIPLDWIEGFSITQNKMTLYPINWNNNYQTSNGLASGNTKEEAIVQAICEVIERHNTAEFVFDYHLKRPLILNNDSIECPITKDLISTYKNQNVDIHLALCLEPIKVPVVVAIAVDKTPQKKVIKEGYGFGCHTDPSKAIIRAITEYSQAKEGLLNNPNISPDLQFKKGRWQFNLNLDIKEILKKAKYINYNDIPNLSQNDFKDEIFFLTDILKKHNLEVIIINKTHQKLGIPVYRVFSPGIHPSAGIFSINQIDHTLITHLYAQAGLMTEAEKYYNENFELIEKDWDNFFNLISTYIDQIENINNDMKNFIKHKNIIRLDKNNAPFRNMLFADNYLDQIKNMTRFFSMNKYVN